MSFLPSVKLACLRLFGRPSFRSLIFPRVSLGAQSWKHNIVRPCQLPQVARPFSKSRPRTQHAFLDDPKLQVLPAPKLQQRPRSPTEDFLLYDPKIFKLLGFESLPGYSTGQVPMKYFYQVLTTPTADTPGTTILLNFPDKRYFFGQISEGTQRACTERGVRLTYLTDIFLTGRMQWADNGGLIGTILTQADSLAGSAAAVEEAAREKEAKGMKPGQNASQRGGGKTKMEHGVPYAVQDGQTVVQRGSLTVHGGRNLTHTVATTRRFIFRKGVPLFTREYDFASTKRDCAGAEDPFEQPSWSDRNIKVWAIPVSPSSQGPSDTPSSSARSPRKRSHDEFEESDQAERSTDQLNSDQLLRQSVVSDMFNSSWRMDSLQETRLADVKMPATIFIRNPVTKDFERYTGPAPGGETPLPDPDIRVHVRKPWPAVTVEKLPPTARSNEALSYVIRNQDFRGKFDPDKATELKVRPGPAFGRLARGENVRSAEGKTVTPDMVLGPPRLGKGIAIIELPTPEYVENLVNRPEWKSPSVTTELEVFIWILGPGVGEHPKLREFVANMSRCQHFVSSTDYCPNYLALNGVAESSVRLARLKGDSYSIPVHDNVTLPQSGTRTAKSETTKEAIRTSPFEPMEPGFIIDMEPKFGPNRTEVVPRVNPATIMQRIPRAVEQRMSTTRRRVSRPEFRAKLEELQKGLVCGHAEIVALGTGSSSPSKYRNVSATLVHVPGYGYYMLDCGENTLGQLKRVYEPEKLRHVLQNLRMIWISHLHADHHLGTISLIKAWYEVNYGFEASSTPTSYVEYDMKKVLGEKRLFLVSDEMMISWLEEYTAVENFGFDKLIPLSAHPAKEDDGTVRTRFKYHHVSENGTYPGHETWGSIPTTTVLRFDNPSSPLSSQLRSATGLSNILTARVNHCRGALAVSLVFPNGFKLSYSGDCRPSPNFAAIGQGSTVLIHEATFGDDMHGNAVAKKHSTTAEALEIGRRMQARTILLTHFSQRYQKVASVDQRFGTVKREENLIAPANTPAPDVPLDNEGDDGDGDGDDEAEGTEQQAPRQRGRREVSLPRRAAAPTATPPVTVAFDYMRVRVQDIPMAQMYAPALEKLFMILEVSSSEEGEKLRMERFEEESKNKKSEGKKGKQAKLTAPGPKNKKKDGAAPSGSGSSPTRRAGSPPTSSPTRGGAGRKSKRDVSVWSASESESGWSD